jgi:sarcosine oxidase
MTKSFDVIVVGGGIHGLCAAWGLVKAGAGRVAVIEQFGLGHDRGSSHGESRITRSTYSNATYIRLMQAAHATAWPALAEDLGKELIRPRPMCLFGPAGGPVEDYHRAVLEAGAPVARLDLQAARERFPQFDFAEDSVVLDDPTAGVIAAKDTMDGLVAWLLDHGVCLLPNHVVTSVRQIGDAVTVQTERQALQADRVVVTAGAWTSKLIPLWVRRLTPIRQTVVFLRFDGSDGDRQAEQLPVWVYVGRTQNDVFYGLPRFGRPGIKIARHVTTGPRDCPDENPGVDPDRLQDVVAAAQQLFRLAIGSVVSAETCFYTNTATEDVIWDLHPESRRIVVGAGFSGHGFKFGPLSGQFLAELAMTGSCSHPLFVAHQPNKDGDPKAAV